METINIIIADDEEFIHESLRNTLDSIKFIKFNYKIIKDCYDTMGLLRYLYTLKLKHNEQPDVLILDNYFGGGSVKGLEALPHIRKANPTLPILMLTTFGLDDADFIKAREKYQIDYIQKPVKSNDLGFRINDILKRKEEWTALQQQIVETRKWAFQTFNLANKQDIDDIDFSDKIEWNRYQQKILSIADKMKEYDIKRQGNNSSGISFDMIRKTISMIFDKANPKAQEALATGEYLYRMHKNEDIDFSPVLISYSKALESTLKQFLLSLGYPVSVSKEMLNNLVMKMNANLETIGGNKKIIDNIKKFQKKRNKAAHVSGISIEVLQDLRNMLIDTENSQSDCIINILNQYMPSKIAP